jgi:hypothetical protein
MAKRIITLDYLRGFAVIMVLLFHIILTAWDMSIKIRDGVIDPFSLPLPLIILFVFVLVFGYWRGLFLIISAAVHMYGMSIAIQKGTNRGILLLKQILTGFILIIWGGIAEMLFNDWGMIKRWGNGEGLFIQISDLYNSEAYVNIGWGIIIASCILLLLARKDGILKTRRNALVFAICGVILIIVTPYIYQAVNNAYGATINLQNWSHLPDVHNEFNVGFWIVSWFFCVESPTLTALGYTFAGCVIGILLGAKSVSKNVYRGGLLGGLLIFLIGAVMAFLKIMETLNSGGNLVALLDVHVHPTWFQLTMMGLQIIVLFVCLRFIEFNPRVNIERAKKYTLYLRRWGVLALTIYSFSVLQYFIRWILDPFTSLSLVKHGGADSLWLVIIIVVDLIFWTLVIWLWGKGKFIGSLEWLMLLAAKRGKQYDRKDPLNVKGTLFEVEPVIFVEQKQKK